MIHVRADQEKNIRNVTEYKNMEESQLNSNPDKSKEGKAINQESIDKMTDMIGDVLTQEFSSEIGNMNMFEIMEWTEENCTDEKLKQYRNLVVNTILSRQSEGELLSDTTLSIGEITELFDTVVSTQAASIRNQIKNKSVRREE